MARDRETGTSTEGLITDPNYIPDTPGRVVAEDFRRVVDYAIDQLIQTEEGGGPRADVNYIYSGLNAAKIRRITTLKRGGLFGLRKRLLYDQANFGAVKVKDQFTRVGLHRDVAEGRSRDRPLTTTDSGAYLFSPGDIRAYAQFSYESIGHKGRAMFGINKAGQGVREIVLYDETSAPEQTPVIGDLASDLRDMALVLNAAALACSQQLEPLRAQQNEILSDPYEAKPGLLSRLIPH